MCSDRPQTPPRPAPHARDVCAWCGYDLAGLGAPRCPECGREGTTQDPALSLRRSRLLDAAWPLAARRLSLFAIAACLNAAAVRLHGAALAQVLSVLVAGLLAVLTALAAGLPVVLISRPWERPLVALLWIRNLWWLMLGLVSIPALALLAAAVSFLFSGAATSALDRVVLVLVAVAPLWATLALTGLWAWGNEWSESEELVTRRTRARSLAAFLGAACALLASLGVGVYTGALCLAQLVSNLPK